MIGIASITFILAIFSFSIKQFWAKNNHYLHKNACNLDNSHLALNKHDHNNRATEWCPPCGWGKLSEPHIHYLGVCSKVRLWNTSCWDWQSQKWSKKSVKFQPASWRTIQTQVMPKPALKYTHTEEKRSELEKSQMLSNGVKATVKPLWKFLYFHDVRVNRQKR